MTTRQTYDLYVDNVHVRTILSGWPIGRIMAQLVKKNPDAMNLKVRLHEEESSVHILRA